MKKTSLRFKLLFGGILIVLIPLFIVGLFASYKSAQALQDSSREQSANVAKNLAALVEATMSGEVKLIAAFAADVGLLEPAAQNSAPVIAKLSEVVKKIGENYEGIYVTDTEGIIRADGDGKSMGLNLGNRDYFQAAKAGKVTIGAPAKSRKTGNPIVVVAAPVYHNGAFTGIMGAAIKMDTLLNTISSIKIGRTGYPFMVDAAGRVIAHPKKELVFEANLSDFKEMAQITQKIMARQTGSERYAFKGSDKMGGFAPVNITGWAIIATQDEEEFLSASRAIRNVILVTALIFLALTIGGLLYFARSITVPVDTATKKLTEASEQVAAAAGEVASASQSLAEGASEQASALEETSSSLEELSSMTRRNADNASHADALMKDIGQGVRNANDAMSQLAQSMDNISTASQETSKIIKTIDEIAFQTNLLALNAAVEAARAGEAGAGFAVVADEVRSLAMRAAEAARTTSSLIEDTVKKIQGGSQLVTKTEDAFSSVSTGTKKIDELVSEMAVASQEQAQGIDQINRAVAEMDKVVQSVAASAEESAASSEELNALAEQMRQVIAQLADIVGGSEAQTIPGTALALRDPS